MFVLCGKTASGKDTIANKLIKLGYKRIVTYTTRPKRRGEVQGKTYNYVTDEDFFRMVEERLFVEHNEYHTAEGIWYYGTPFDEIEKADDKTFAILSPSGVRAILENVKPAPTVLYIYANDKTIQKRLRKRGDNAEECKRRVKNDHVDFANMEYVANRIIYNNDGTSIDDVVEKVLKAVERS